MGKLTQRDSRGPLVLVALFPAKTVPEFIAYAKANPGKISFGSAGIGTGAKWPTNCSRLWRESI
jgi:tripartite-type tricarboxylate transporter receptor subunit TctC